MRALRHLLLLLTFIAPAAFADGYYQIEVIVFRQAGEATPAAQLAPEDWAVGTQAPSAERATALNGEAAKLNPANGYQVLLHQSFAQQLGGAPVKIALTAGNQQFGHFPVEGSLSLKHVRFVDVIADFWVNQFDANGVLTASEHVKQNSRLKDGNLTYLDHSNLGVLIKASPL
jgi:hypothetical protein